MYTCIIAILVGVILAVILDRRASDNPNRLLYLGHYLFFGAFGGWMVGIFMTGFVTPYLTYRQVAHQPITLSAMRSADGVQGTFLMGTGSVSSEVYYHFLYKAGDGSLIPFTLQSDSTVRIVEDATLQNEGRWITTTKEVEPTSPLKNWVLDCPPKVVRQEFRVPVGTVVTKFTIR